MVVVSVSAEYYYSSVGTLYLVTSLVASSGLASSSFSKGNGCY